MHNMEERGPQEWLAMLRATLTHDDQIRIFVTLWAIWHARRKAIHEQQYQSPLSVHAFIEKFVVDLSQDDHKEEQRRVASGTSEAPAWIPPP
jgi:hypothetical protein